MTPSTAQSEAQIQHSILLAWGAHPMLRIWRANTGIATMGDRKVKFGVRGQCDISGILGPHGRRIEMEVKTEIGRLSEAQINWQRMILNFGGAYCLVRSLADADAFFRSLGVTR